MNENIRMWSCTHIRTPCSLQTPSPFSDILPASALPLNGQWPLGPREVTLERSSLCWPRPASCPWGFQQRPREKRWLGGKVTGSMMLAPQPSTGQRGGAENDEGAETDPEKEETGADPVRKWAQSEEDGRTSPGHESSPFRVQRPGHTAAHKASCHVSAAELAVSVAGHLSHRTFGTLQHRAERTVAQQRPPLPSSRAVVNE